MTMIAMKNLAPAACLLALFASACERKAKSAAPAPTASAAAPPVAPGPALTGFQHDAAFDAQGYYLPHDVIKVGTLKLDHIAIGAPSDFKQWEAGEREAVFGPIFLQFSDESSPSSTNEMGAEVHTVMVRVLPTAYRVFPGGVSFRATDPKLGEIGFVGAIDPLALTAARDGGGEGQPVLKGDLSIGETRIAEVRFTYFLGD